MSKNEPIVRFFRADRDAPDIRPAEKGAAGTMPAAALQYCEAMRRAASAGFYVYPPRDVSLFFDGYEVFIHDDDAWIPLKSYTLGDQMRADWNAAAPPGLQDCDPPFTTELFVRGAVQIWSGYFVQTAPGWSLHMRSPVNYGARSSLLHYEGIVDTDRYCPAPLFINFQIAKTDTEIFIPRDRPLFQAMPIYRKLPGGSAFPFQLTEMFDNPDAEFDWDGVRNTLRRAEDRDTSRPGRYATSARKASDERD